MSTMRVPSVLAAGALLALAASSPAVHAQDPAPRPAPTVATQVGQNVAPAGRDASRDELARRNRSDLHSGQPIELVGQAQGDEGLRQRTPALLNFKHTERPVDEEQAYQRALALHAERASFTSPLPHAVVPPVDAANARPAHPAPPVLPPPGDLAREEKPGASWAWLLAVGIAAVLTAWFLRRQGGSGDANRRAPASSRA